MISDRELPPRASDLQGWYDSYWGQGKHYLSDPARPDASTKRKLMDDAWALFLAEGLVFRIPKLVSHHMLMIP